MGSTGRGGKPKGQRASRWRDWRPDEDTTLKMMMGTTAQTGGANDSRTHRIAIIFTH
jgi:hypothetical protein